MLGGLYHHPGQLEARYPLEEVGIPDIDEKKWHLMNSNTEIKILIADDDQIIRDGLSSLLDSQDGLRVVTTVENSQEVFAQLQAHPVDLVLLDVDMPVVSGIEAARKLKLEYLDVTIVMLTVFEHVESLG